MWWSNYYRYLDNENGSVPICRPFISYYYWRVPSLVGTRRYIGGIKFSFLWIDIKTYKNMSEWKYDKHSFCKFFFSLTQLNYFFMIHLVIFSSTIMYKSTYVFVRIEVLAKTKVRCLRWILRKQRTLYYYNYDNIRN